MLRCDVLPGSSLAFGSFASATNLPREQVKLPIAVFLLQAELHARLTAFRRMDRRTLVDDVVAAVDVQRFAGNEPSGVVRKERRGNANVVDADKAAGRGLFLRLVEQLIELGDSRCGARGERSGRDRV